MTMNRRRFLKLTGYGLSAGLVGLGAGLAWIQPRRQRLPARAPDDAARPLHATSRKRVVVVGGGLAGLAAAVELAGRRFDVTLVERAEHLGGKVGGWTIRALGEAFPVEHGFHGFFSQYYNLDELLAAAGAQANLVESPDYRVLFSDRPPEVHLPGSTLFPLNLAAVVRRSPTLRFKDFRHDGPALYELMKYHPERTFARLDGASFAEFARDGGINAGMRDVVLEPFGKTTLNRTSRLSAAEAIRFFHFYFMGNPEGFRYRVSRTDTLSAVVEPLERLLVQRGGRVRKGVGARRLERGPGGIARVVVDGDPAPPAVARVSEREVPAEGFRALPQPDGSSIFVARRPGGWLALDGRCTHMGCPVAPEPSGGFLCPCHGGRFDAEGAPAGGPPKRPLRRLAVHAEGGLLAVGGAAPGAREEALDCDYCVVACEVRGLKQLVSASSLEAPALERGVARLGEADPYVVWRLWLDKPTAPGRPAFATCSRFRYLDSLAIYSLLQEPYIGWARRSGGSVIEAHAYAIAPEHLEAPEAMRPVIRAEVERLLPELAGARVLHEEFQLQSNFTRFAPGDHASRPTTETAVGNLVLAGDHVELGVPAYLMEGATLSGRMAANAILRKEGLREIPLATVALKGPLA